MTPQAPADEGLPPESFLRRIWRMSKDYFNGEEKRQARRLGIGVLVLTVLQIGIQVRFNIWNRDFFNALELRDRSAFFGQMGLFLGLTIASMATAVGQLYVRQMLQLHWRRWLVYRLQHHWLSDGRHYQINFLPDAADNPDQRISENTRWATTIAVDMAVGLISSVLMLVSFVGILWTLSGPLQIALGANEFEIPGYMVFAALIYAGLGSVLTFFIGRPMVEANIRRNQSEGDHRFALIRLRESSEGVALIRGEADEERGLKQAFERVVVSMTDLMRSERRLMWLTSAYGMLLTVFPVLVASPRYFAGAITLGVLMQISSAFGQVTTSLNWFVDNFPRIAEWRSHVDRVVELEETPGLGGYQRGRQRHHHRGRSRRGRARRAGLPQPADRPGRRVHGDRRRQRGNRPRRTRVDRGGKRHREIHPVPRHCRAVALGSRGNPHPGPRQHDVHAPTALSAAGDPACGGGLSCGGAALPETGGGGGADTLRPGTPDTAARRGRTLGPDPLLGRAAEARLHPAAAASTAMGVHG